MKWSKTKTQNKRQAQKKRAEERKQRKRHEKLKTRKLVKNKSKHYVQDQDNENLIGDLKMENELSLNPQQSMHAIMLLQIANAIYRMNTIMELPHPSLPTEVTTERLVEFKAILEKECSEINEVIECESTDRFDRLTMYADLLGDIIVYCWSEMIRHGIPMAPVMGSIMESNFSKLGPDGKPVPGDQPGKFGKGPNFQPAEPAIREGLMSMRGPSALEKAGVVLPN